MIIKNANTSFDDIGLTERKNIGTAFYSSIELNNYTSKSELILTDLFSYGAIICFLLTNNHPFNKIKKSVLDNGDILPKSIIDMYIKNYFITDKKIIKTIKDFEKQRFKIGENDDINLKKFKNLEIINFLIEIFEKTYIIDKKLNHNDIINSFQYFFQKNYLFLDNNNKNLIDTLNNFNILLYCYNDKCTFYKKNILIPIIDKNFNIENIYYFKCQYCRNNFTIFNILKFIFKNW
jgi:hypothetical protein